MTLAHEVSAHAVELFLQKCAALSISYEAC